MHTCLDSIHIKLFCEKQYEIAIKMYGVIQKSQITRLKPTV